MVSGLFHSPLRGSFHLSLTVLLRYRLSSVFSLGRWSAQFPTGLACPVVLRIPPFHFRCAYRTLTFSGWPSQTIRLRFRFPSGVLQPRRPRTTVWAPPLSLATTRGILSFPRGTQMFHFPRFPPHTFQPAVTRYDPGRVSPFGHLWLLRLHTARQSFSQCTTSFFGT